MYDNDFKLLHWLFNGTNLCKKLVLKVVWVSKYGSLKHKNSRALCSKEGPQTFKMTLFPVVGVRNNSTQPVVKTANTLPLSFAQKYVGEID